MQDTSAKFFLKHLCGIKPRYIGTYSCTRAGARILAPGQERILAPGQKRTQVSELEHGIDLYNYEIPGARSAVRVIPRLPSGAGAARCGCPRRRRRRRGRRRARGAIAAQSHARHPDQRAPGRPRRSSVVSLTSARVERPFFPWTPSSETPSSAKPSPSREARPTSAPAGGRSVRGAGLPRRASRIYSPTPGGTPLNYAATVASAGLASVLFIGAILPQNYAKSSAESPPTTRVEGGPYFRARPTHRVRSRRPPARARRRSGARSCPVY